MSHLLFWPTRTFFYPVGNTSAVCLTENLPPESKADVLLLACGDPRHILYTIYVNETNSPLDLRNFDVTCCDMDAAVLARNALLFTLLADDAIPDKLDTLWDLFYHMFVNQGTLSMLFEQCRKLIPLAESTETWRTGPYGHFLTTCDAATLAQLRRIWTTYLNTASFSSKQAKCFEQRFTEGLNQMSQELGRGGTSPAARSAGPLALHAHEAVSRQFSSYWASGVTDDSAQGKGRGQRRRLSANPTFAFSIDGDKFSVHYATDPLSGFHLAEAFASGRFTHLHECIPPHELVRVAKDQFSRWCTAVSKRLKGSNSSSSTFVIRFYAGDALSFCQALKYCEMTQSLVTPYHVAAWKLSTITLNHHYYGRNALSPAPLSFNVIDTSNILDHVGLVNILVVSTPLLRKTPSATLYTEALLRTGDNPSQAILEHLCGDLPTMALLLGIVPWTFISHFTTRSNAYETLMMSEGTKQYHERLAWKAIGLGRLGLSAQHTEVPTPPQRLCFSPEDLAAFLFRVYLHMFSDEDLQSRFQLLSLSPERMVQELKRSGILHYNRRSFALFVHLVKTQVQTDWHRTMDLFEDLTLADRRLLTGQHAYQELCCQLHLLGVYSVPWLSDPPLRTWEDGNVLRVFPDWTRTCIPPIVTLVLVVPRAAIAQLEPEFKEVGTPVLHCDMHDGPRQNWFAVTAATFGTLRISGTGENRVGIVIEGDGHAPAARPPWRTEAPLIVTFSLPSSSVVDFARSPGSTVGLALRSTMGVAAKFTDRLGFDLTVFRTRLADAEHVFVLAQQPMVTKSANTDTSAILVGHWQESACRTEQDADASHGASTDVHVQMNHTASALQSFTVRIDITDPGAQVALTDTQTVPTIRSGTSSSQSLSACVKIGTYSHTVQFPLPIDVARTKLRVARRSSYIEIVVPLTSFDVRPERDLSSRFGSLSWDPNDAGTLTLGSIHRVNLDRCPTLKLSKTLSTLNWCDMHVSLMFSELEKKRALHENNTNTNTPDILLHVKQTLHLILRCAAGTTPDSKAPEKVFALFDTSSGCKIAYLYIIVAHMCLDIGSHTVVADAFVAPGTPTMQASLDTGIALHAGSAFEWTDGPCRGQFQNPLADTTAIRYIGTDADETVAWFYLLPHLTERCRTWSHKTTCAYHSSRFGEDGFLGGWGSQSPLCSCGAGVGTEILPKQFKCIAPYLTRAAFSPLFSVPYLKEVDMPVVGPVTGMGTSPRKNVALTSKCWSCGKEGSLKCGRCKRARYCSEACQRADWKAHKKDCESALEVVRGADLA